MRIRTYRVVCGIHWFDIKVAAIHNAGAHAIYSLGWILFMPDQSDGRWWVIRPSHIESGKECDIRIDAHDLDDASEKALEVLGWSKPILIAEEEG